MSDSTKINEKRLIADIKAGKKAAYKSVYLKYYERLCIYVLNYTQDRNLAEDIVQDTFLSLWTKRSTLRVDGSLNGYLYRLTYNKFVDVCRKNKQHNNELETLRNEALDDLMEDYEEVYTKKMAQVEKAIDTLPPRCKEVFLLNKMDGMRYREIADHLGISLKTVENQIGKALVSIRKHLSALIITLFLLLKLQLQSIPPSKYIYVFRF